MFGRARTLARPKSARPLRRLLYEGLEHRHLLSVAGGESLPGHWIVQFDGLEGSPEQQQSALTQRFSQAGVQGVTLSQSLGLAGMFTVETSPATTLESLSDALFNVEGFEFVEPDRLISSSALPNDSSFGNLWGMHNTGQVVNGIAGVADADSDAPEAWDLTTGSSSVVVGVIDSGIDFTHPDLDNNVFINPGEIPNNFVDDDSNGFIDDWRGWDFFNNDNNPTDDLGHGTHVSGTIGAEGNNAQGVAGVNWDVTILPLKFLGSGGTGPVSAAVAAINYATMMRNRGFNIVVTNNSWGASFDDSALSAAITAHRNAGILFVAAAGNGGFDGFGDNNDFTSHFPSNYTQDNILAVAALDNRNQRASFSNYGLSSVDLGAPGVSVYSTVPGGYAYYDGTSMATPHVAGAAALLWSAAPAATYTQVRDAILASVDPVSSLAGMTATGGKLNVRRALEQLVAGPRVSSLSIGTDAIGAAVSATLSFTKPIDPLTFTADDLVSFSGPGGADLLSAVTGITAVSANTFRIDFAAQTQVGAYAITIGPNILDTDGEPMDQDGDLTAGEVPQDRFVAGFSIDGPRVTSSTPSGPQIDPVSSITLTFSKEIDPASFTLTDVASFTGPGGTDLLAALTGIAQVSATKFRLDIGAQGGVGSYTLVVGPDIHDLAGHSMDQDSDGVLAEPVQDRFAASFSIAAPRVLSTTVNADAAGAVTSLAFLFSKPIAVASFTAADIVSFVGPGGIDLLAEVTGVVAVNTTLIRVDLTPQRLAGNYSLTIGPNILDTGGNPLDQNSNSIPGEVPNDRYTASFSIVAPRVLSASPIGTQAGPVAGITFTFSKAIDASTFTAADVASFTGPKGVNLFSAITGVTQLTSTTLRVDFAPQGPAGNYAMLIGPDIRDVLGNPLDQDLDRIGGEPVADRFAATFSISSLRITASTPAAAAVVGGTQNNILLDFSKAIDAASFTLGDLNFTGPGGSNLSSSLSSIASVSATRFQVNFSALTAPGAYQLTVGPGVLDLAGNPLDQDNDGTAGEPVDDRFILPFSFNFQGPDGFGYTASVGTFENIDLEPGQAGVFEILDDVDDGSVAVDLGSNSFNFYGVTYTGNSQLFVSSNGLVTLGAANNSSSNSSLDFSPATPAIAPFWDDLETHLTADDEVLGRFEDQNGDSIADRLVIEWSDMQDWAVSGSGAGTFQLILQLNTGARVSSFVYNYVDLDFGTAFTNNGSSASVGIKSSGTQSNNPNRLLVSNNNGSHPFLGSGKAIHWAAGSTIQGQVWRDRDADGVRDPGDDAEAGWTVYLDLDQDQLRDTGEPSLVTGTDGSYAFANLLPGNYLVRAVDQVGWVPTAPAEVFATPVANGGFESGVLAPEWSSIGVATVIGSVGDVPPPEAGRQAAISNVTSSVNSVALADYMGRPATTLDTLIGATVAEGSALKRSITAAAGQTLTFQWNFYTDESVNSSFGNDFAFVSLVGPAGADILQVLSSTFNTFVTVPGTSNFTRMTGNRTFTYEVPTDGVYTLAIGVCDVGSTFTDSQIAVDDLQLTGGPDSFGRPHHVAVASAKSIISNKDFANYLLLGPVAIALVGGSIAENQAIDTVVGTLSTTDDNPQETFSYSLVDGEGSLDNALFTIDGATVRTAAIFSFEQQSSYSIRIRSTNSIGQFTEQAFVVSVLDANDPGVVTLAGSATQGQTLSASPSDEDGLGVAHYLWQRSTDGFASYVHVGSDTDSYTPDQSDVGATLRVVVTYVDQSGAAESVTSDATAIVGNVNDLPTGDVLIVGNVLQGTTLTASTSLADADVLGTPHFQWQRSADDFVSFTDVGDDASAYQLTQADVGMRIRLIVSYTDGFGAQDSVTSDLTTAVGNVNDAPAGLVLLVGQAAEDQTITADTTLLGDIDGLGTLHYQWQRSSNGFVTVTDVGSDSSTYTADQADVGARMRVLVSYTDSFGASESVASVVSTTVTNVNDAPLLNNTLNPTLVSVSEDAVNPATTLVASLLSGAVSDPDAGALRGIAVTGASGANGTWQYLLKGSSSWSGMNPSSSAALLLPGSARIRFLPAANFNGQVQLSYRAWDQTQGRAGGTLDVIDNSGGSHSLSVDDETATLTVDAKNDAPVLDNTLSPTLISIPEDVQTPASTLVSSLLTGAVTDVDAGASRGIAVYVASNFNGLWQFKLAGGSWQSMGAVSDTAALLLPADARVRFIPKADFNGTVKLYYRAWDRTQGTSGGTFSLKNNLGGIKAFSTAKENAALLVTPVNDKPVLSFSGSIGYVHDTPAITLAPYARVTDIDGADFAGGQLTVRITTGAGASNLLGIGAAFTVDANNNVLLGSTIIGTLNADGGEGTTDLVVTFQPGTTQAIVQQLVRAITFKTIGGTAGTRSVLFSVSDGDGGLSAEVTKMLNVT